MANEFEELETGANRRAAGAPGTSMHEIIQQSASVLLRDGTISMRSNKEIPPDRRNPLFPLRKEGTPRRLTERQHVGRSWP